MAFGDTQNGSLSRGEARNANGSVKSDWQRANTALSTVNTDSLLNIDAGTYATVIPLTIPDGATRCWIRASAPTTSFSVTTQPVVKLVAADGAGTPERIDSADSDSAGVTLTITAAGGFTDASAYWSDVSGPYDLNCNGTLYMLVSTAASLGSVPVGWVRFGN